jgi:hypothetical protein
VILFTADWHLNDNPRDAYRHDFIDWLIKIMREKYRIDLLLMAGDITDEKDHHGAGLVNRIADHLKRLSRETDVVLLRGNHDYLDADVPFFSFLRHQSGVMWINKPTFAPDDVRLRLLGNAWLLPHTFNYERDWKGLKFQGVKRYFAHNTFAGAQIGPDRELKGIPVEVFPKGSSVYSGDIHVAQTFGPITYVGAPYTIDFGDTYRPRVLLLDNENFWAGKSLSVPGRQKVLVTVHSMKELKRAKIKEGDIIKVRYVLDSQDRSSWPELQKGIRDWGQEVGAAVHTVAPVLMGDTPAKKQARDNRLVADDELLKQYANSRGLSAAQIKTGLTLLVGA